VRGVFVVTQLYGLARPTADVDVIELAPREASETLMQIQERYDAELRWQLGRPDREDLTMKLWMEMLSE
jgi:hypothetical protein